MKIVYILLIALTASTLKGQDLIDVSGEWRGSSAFLAIPSHLRMTITQEGNQLSGYVYNRSMNQQDSAKKVITGVIRGTTIDMREVDYEYRTSGFCLASVQLEVSKEGNYRKLEGRWKGDLSWKTCAPGTAGPVLVYQESNTPDTGQTKSAEYDEVKPNYSQTNKNQTGSPAGQSAEKLAQSDQEVEKPALDEMGEGLVNELRNREYFALIIGVDRYKSRDIISLDNPVADARKLSDVLITRYGFKAANVVRMENPTRAAIIDELDNLAKRVTEKDNLLIFYAGHGIWDEQLNQGYWLPSDATADSKSYWLSNSTLRDYLGGIKSKHTLLIADACFSGGILKERGVELSSKAMLELYRLPSRKAMTSGTMTTVPDKSVFMNYLIKNLERNEYPLFSAAQLFQQFKIAVIHNSPTGQVPQYGAITLTGDEGGDFIFLLEN